jgi:hypothetical protein
MKRICKTNKQSPKKYTGDLAAKDLNLTDKWLFGIGFDQKLGNHWTFRIICFWEYRHLNQDFSDLLIKCR